MTLRYTIQHKIIEESVLLKRRVRQILKINEKKQIEQANSVDPFEMALLIALYFEKEGYTGFGLSVILYLRMDPCWVL